MSRNPALRREMLFQLTDVARAMRTHVDQRAREHGMTRAQWGVLLRLERQEGMMQAEMAESLEIQPISLARLIDRLCDQKLVERRPHPQRPARQPPLSHRQGPHHARPAWCPLGREISGEVLASFSEAETAALLQKLLRIKSNIRKSSAANGARRRANGVRHAG